MQIVRSALIAATCLAVLAACEATGPGGNLPKVLPQKQALEDIHDIYRAEFAELFLSGEGEQPGCLSSLPAASQPTFSQTRSAIRAFRVQFGTKDAEAAHLTVLDAMMHLQVGNVGLAGLLKSDVEAAKGNLVSQTGRFTRDFLFAEYFDPLLAGWGVVCDLTASPPKAIDRAADELEAAASEIAEGLTAFAQSGQLADPDADQGAIYLAATTAVFNVWAVKESGQRCIEQGDCGCDATVNSCPTPAVISNTCGAETDPLERRECQQDLRRSYFNETIRPARYAQSRDLIGLFLDDSEKMLALCSESGAMARATSSSRLRYVSWYRFLSDRLPNSAAQEICTP
ncbi:hypothetical protein [Denitrobaculum tricleocarpae]|uniref:Lipoprotein n=1 Tax=Denitrobaculum tricleocarpae TaxID=2591009 RepID=A0A545TXB3_9PROT|nr:hypothetical protein [Denitrobaculum tricleocarpae]TQV81859.1 hypothetical protein FKG95_06365 [Denitrobaculum tricleocarpae]